MNKKIETLIKRLSTKKGLKKCFFRVRHGDELYTISVERELSLDVNDKFTVNIPMTAEGGEVAEGVVYAK